VGILDTGVRHVRNVGGFTFGNKSLSDLEQIIATRKEFDGGYVIYFIDSYFSKSQEILSLLPIANEDRIIFVETHKEPSTDVIDEIVEGLRANMVKRPSAVVGMGGGIAMDTAKAISNLLANEGKAENYQGWDLLKNPAVFKIAIPTISGTGAEATRTCVMTNKRTGLKLGMNSDFTVFDHIIMDPSLTCTVPRDQYFYTGMDAYIHCVEALAGSYRNAIGDAYSRETINLCRQVFLEGDMMSDSNRERLMVASYLGGCAIATSYVGLVHPFSAGLSVVLGLHHCVANCIVMRAMEPFYPEEFNEFWSMAESQNVNIPIGVARELSSEQYEQIFESTVIHEKPLTNALGENFRQILTKEKVVEIFKKM
jgi:3-deoxy-alpha-D-manno-octulosonate 8-oxidase